MSVNDSLQKENMSKDREIRRLNKDVNQYEQVILNLRKEVSMNSCNAIQCPKKDAEVMVDTCCRKGSECVVEVNYGAMLKDDAVKYQERMITKEGNLKSVETILTLRKVNVALSEELHALRKVCAALDEQCCASKMRAQFKDEIINEMRRQLKQAKAKLRESDRFASKDQKDFVDGDKTRSPVSSYGSRGVCVRQQPRKKREFNSPEAPLHPESDCTPRFDGSGDDGL